MELYHCLNRGVDKRTIFLDEHDYARFIHDLFEFNDANPATNVGYQKKSRNSEGVGRPPSTHAHIVNIHGWCLMRNHYHLLLSERIDGGLSLFLRKLNVGYANYFNERHEREGTLFQGRTKKILIERDAHFLYILHYIHLNPLDVRRETAEWRTGKVPSARRALEYLEAYKWSSYQDYVGIKNFPSILTTDLFSDVFPAYKKALNEYLGDMELPALKSYELE